MPSKPEKKKVSKEYLSHIRSRASSGKHDRLWAKHPTGICGIPGCGKKHFMKDMCIMHYNRWMKHGTPGPVGELRRRKRNNCSFDEAHAAPMPTEAGRAAQTQKVRGVVHAERARRLRALAALVDQLGCTWECVSATSDARMFRGHSGTCVEVSNATAEILAASGWLADGGRGTSRLTRSGEEAVSIWTLGANEASAEPIREGSGSEAGSTEMRGDLAQDGGTLSAESGIEGLVVSKPSETQGAQRG